MEDHTPITISSVSAISVMSTPPAPFLQRAYNTKAEVISLGTSSSATMRCPVTWTSVKKPKHDSFGFSTPSVNDRVQAWMGFNVKEQIVPEPMKNSVLVRRDFNKVVKEDDIETQSSIKHVTSLCSYLENKKAKGRKTPNPIADLDPIKRLETATYEYEMQLLNSSAKSTNTSFKTAPQRFAKDSPQTLSTCNSRCNSSSYNDDSRHSLKDSEIYEVPLSPESQKKELCTYLQLMNPADKKETLLLQNRRSVRVRNQNIMLEKKQLELQLKKKSEGIHSHSSHSIKKHKPSFACSIETTEDSSDSCHPTLKSFKDLSMQVPYIDLNRFDKKALKIQKKVERIIQQVPPQAEQQIDFDDIFIEWSNQEDIREEIKDNQHNNDTRSKAESEVNSLPAKKKRVKKLVNNKSRPKGKVNSSSDRNKDNKQKRKVNNKRLLRRLMSNPEKLRALRSRNNLKNKSIENLIIERRLRNGHIRKRLKKIKKNIVARKPQTVESTTDDSKAKTVDDNMRDDKTKIVDSNVDDSKTKTADDNVLDVPEPIEAATDNVLDVPVSTKTADENALDVHVSTKTNIVEAINIPIIPSCDIVSVQESLGETHDHVELNLREFVEFDDLNCLSQEHRKVLIESRIISRRTPHDQDDFNSVISRHTPSLIDSNSHCDYNKDRDALKSPAVNSGKVVEANSPLLVNGHDQLGYITPKSPYRDILYKVDYKPMSDKVSPEVISSKENQDFTKTAINEGEIIYAPQKNLEIVPNNTEKDEARDLDFNLQDRSIINLSTIELPLDINLDSVIRSGNIPDTQKDPSDHSSSQFSGSSSSSSSSCSRPVSVRSNAPTIDHDYIISSSDDGSESVCSSIPSPKYEKISTNDIELKEYPLIPLNKPTQMKTLLKSLTQVKKRKTKSITNSIDGANSDFSWSSDSESRSDSIPENQRVRNRRVNSSHSVNISPSDGAILKAFFVDDNLFVCQEYLISFWNQSALGQVLGAQNMWVPRGKIRRLVLTDNSIQKDSSEMVISMHDTLAYVELWTKEHKSEIREGPVADVFATIYFWRHGLKGLEKKVLQLENINGFCDDVQYAVSKSSRRIIVSWHSVTDCTKGTYVHSYELAADFQTVENINEIESIKHYVSSLHEVEDCESLLMGCGENMVTLWNLDYGYIVATIELTQMKSSLVTLWVKCIRGYLFTVQQCVDGELRLIAINGTNHTWKKLQSFNPPSGFDRLKGVTVENGILVSFYDQGLLCWNAQTGEPVVEEIPNETDYIPSGEFVIMNINGQIIVRQALTHLIVTDDSQNS